MAIDLLTGAVLGSVVDKLLTKVLQATSLYLNHSKLCKELHTLLIRLRPVALRICAKAKDGGDAAASNWVQCLCKELEKADEILQRSSEAWKIVSSKDIMSVMQSMNRLVQEVGVVGLSSTQSVDSKVERLGDETREYFETLSTQLTSLQNRFELAARTRKVLLTPACNFGHSIGAISVDLAFSDINESAVSALGAPSVDAVHESVGVTAARKLRRQDSGTVFGGAQVVEDMERVLLSEDEGIRWVGVWATGGAGKTLTAQRLYNSPALQSFFSGGTMWVTVGRNTPIRKLLQALSGRCAGCYQRAPLSSDVDTKNRLCEQLQNMQKAVLFLDDVWNGVVLDWLDVLPAGGMNRIFVTTRNVQVLERKHAVKMQIPMLPAEDSWKLFCWHAFRGAEKVLPHLEGVARQVVDECKGLPLALKVIGAAFASKTEPLYWRRSLEKLKKAEVLSPEHEQQLLLRLEISLEELPTLHPYLKDCFLYFAAFPEGAQVTVEDLLDAWVGEGIVQEGSTHTYDSPEIEAFELLGWLIARSLIELQPPKMASYIHQLFMTCKIHDVLRDLARYVLQQPREPHRRDCLYKAGRHLECFPPEWIITDTSRELSVRRLSLCFNSLTELPQHLHAPQLRVLLLRNNPLKELPRSFLGGSRHLKVLDLRCTDITELPSSLCHTLRQLVSLNLSSCRKLKKIPDSLGEMSGLRRLDLSYCYELAPLPSTLSKLTNLQILKLILCYKVWARRREPCLGCTTCTRVTEPLGCKRRAALQDVSRLSSLNELIISSRELTELCIRLDSLKRLRSLEVRFEKVESFPEMGQLKDLEALSFEYSGSLRSLPSSFGKLTHLITLNLSHCKALSTLPASLDQLPLLEVLNLTECFALTSFPSSFSAAGAFPALRELRLRSCRGITHFPPLQAGAMPHLAFLSLAGWFQLTTGLPQPLQQLMRLRTLDAGQCRNLHSLDGSLDLLSLSSLEELDIRGAVALSSLPASLASLPSLKILNIIGSPAAQNIPNELLQLEAEKKLKILRQ